MMYVDIKKCGLLAAKSAGGRSIRFVYSSQSHLGRSVSGKNVYQLSYDDGPRPVGLHSGS